MILNLISFFGGFLISSIVDTSLGEFSEWAIVGAALVVANIESFNNFYYSFTIKNRTTMIRRSSITTFLDILNYFKIGLIYGLIVDAFKVRKLNKISELVTQELPIHLFILSYEIANKLISLTDA